MRLDDAGPAVAPPDAFEMPVAVQRQELRSRPQREPGDDFLAGARLALEKNCGLSRCHARSRREDTLPRWRRTDRASVSAITPVIN